ncbi:aminopeptidase N [Prochlorococcus sp. MIT 1307]|uniref:aminopeptidase N n=1 Tax=Prochlorococcus sp. MIT 1307 TaxID=3096219 RepID=UPI002A75AECD|nr:aminopeptidase N [Prochlorococcus sp. MIT 1307]
MVNKNLVKLSDYKPYPFFLPFIYLDFSIHQEYVRVTSCIHVEPLPDKGDTPLILQGENLALEHLSIEGRLLMEHEYVISSSKLIIKHPPPASFDLKIVTRIDPYNNTSLEGLYLSGSLLTTQCEAEGFRRICFHPDRPDVLSKYRVRVEADFKKYPILLSNGNQITSSKLSLNKERHEVIWDDPNPKPSYLFALVAGDLVQIKDSYSRSSGREVSINLYVESGDEPFTSHAIDSLKRAMKWDEEVYSFEYDLDEYNIVAVRHFNMGAMENKGLNIFNSKLVLADSNIASDDELQRIEGVIAHEYFHNWTGNRITCRDWFQLSLKEGLTVFRDQSFTADLHSASTKRIEDVSFLRNTQFLEDSGPTAHAVKPSEYLAIDNFYTTTIYEKGAELIRMLYTLLGKKSFMKGMKTYVKRFDGCAATTEDFIESIIEGSSDDDCSLYFDHKQFYQWYFQPGTPYVEITRKWDPEVGTLTLKTKQNRSFEINGNNKNPLVIPILIALVSSEGRQGRERLLILEQNQQDFIIEELPKEKKVPTVSLFRGFSAPVRWHSDVSIDELFHLFKFDDDPFSRWNAGQDLMRRALTSRGTGNPDIQLEAGLIETFSYLIKTLGEEDAEVLSTLINLPGSSELELYQEFVDPIGLCEGRLFLQSLFGRTLLPVLKSLLITIRPASLLEWPEGMGARKITSIVWSWLAAGGDAEVLIDAKKAVGGNSMTLAKAALTALKPIDCKEREMAMSEFYERWKDRPVILDAWFALEASTPRKDGLERVRELLEHPRFDRMAPNAVRAVLGGLAANTKLFHAIDGSGYEFMADQIIELDQRNPITASRMAKVFSRWKSYLPVHSEAMSNVLLKLSECDLSSNTREVIELILSA